MQETNVKLENLEAWMKEIDKKLSNHLVHVVADIAQIRTDLDWIKRLFWSVFGVSLSAIVGLIVTLLRK